MKYSPFYTQNFGAMAAAKMPAAAWLAAQHVDVAAIDARIGMNRWETLDFKLKDGRYIYDAMPPGPFYQGWIPREQSQADATFVIGSSIGYGINNLLSNTKDTHKIFVLEPDPEMLTACLGQTDYRQFIQMGKLTFLSPDRTQLLNTVRGCDVQFVYGKIYLRADMASQQIGPEYAYWARECKEMLEHLSVELGTLRRAQDIMVGNELNNFRRALSDGTVNPLRGCAKGMKAVLVGAGPSLAQHGPELAALQHTGLVVTALQTITAMQRVGIKPHLCMSIDYSDGMLNVFDRLDMEWCKDIPLIYSTKTNPEVVRRYPGPTIPLWTIGGLATFIAGRDDLVLDAAGNVSISLIRLLHWMGIQDFVFVGQDFAWKETATHSAGHHAGQFKGKHVDLKDLHGNPIKTSMQYLTSAREMDQDIARLRLNVMNVYGGGYVITNAKNVTLDDAVRAGMLESDDSAVQLFKLRMTQAVTGCEQPVFEERYSAWRTSLRHAQKRLEKLIKKPDRNHDEIRSLFNSLHMFLRQDPIYMPYLYNEILDIAGLRDAVARYGQKDMTRCKAILKRVLEKVTFMDFALGERSLESHRAA